MDFVPLWEQDAWQEGYQQGFQQGYQEVILEEKIKISTALLKKGVPIEIIAESAELPVEEIKKLLPTAD